MNEIVNKMLQLSEEQRNAALDAARMKIAGALDLPARPQREDFNAETHQRFSPRVSQSINILSVFMLVVAFLPSAMRLHEIGLTTFALTISHEASKRIAAICVVFMAEIGQVIFTLGATNAKGFNKFLMWLGAAICTLIALSGNAIAVGNHAWKDLFTALETFAPPVLVLLTSTVLKSQMLDGLEARKRANDDFTAALDAWERTTKALKAEHAEAIANASKHPLYSRIRANALREALRRANARTTTVLRELDDAAWRWLIEREVNADAWFERTQSPVIVAPPMPEEAQPARSLRSAAHTAPTLTPRTQTAGRATGTHTGELDGTVTENADGTHTAKCPSCNWTTTKPEARAAMNALVAHTRHAHPKTQTENA